MRRILYTGSKKSNKALRPPHPPYIRKYSHEIFVRTYCFRMWIFGIIPCSLLLIAGQVMAT
jgi:hypothetical protein